MAKKKKNRQERRAEEARRAELAQKAEAKAAEKKEAKLEAARARAMQRETGKKVEGAETGTEPVKAKDPKASDYDEKAVAKASKEKRAAKKAAAKKEKKQKKPGFFRRIGIFFGEVGVELRKVNWLTRDELARSSAVVFGIVAVFPLLTWLVDSGFGALAAFFLGR